VRNHFYDFLHFHPELQLTLILESRGTFFVGDKITPFEEGDVFLLGPNLPHVFRNDKKSTGVHYKHARAISVYFREDSFGDSFFRIPETKSLKKLIQISRRGLKFSGKVRSIMAERTPALSDKSGFERLIFLFEMLHLISRTPEYEFISSVNFQHTKDDAENKRIQYVYDFIMSNYSHEIDLGKAAAIASMSVTSFCRFFKQRTRKTFIEFVNEVRIGHACKELMYSDDNINEVAFKSGFNNISNFNRKFKEITGFTPSQYSEKTHSHN
jgi:AraC-like DNA-binding protein